MFAVHIHGRGGPGRQVNLFAGLEAGGGCELESKVPSSAAEILGPGQPHRVGLVV